MQHEIIIAGFGGQGILSAGRLLAYAGMLDNNEVSWLPSYGPEMRGGTANSMIVVSDEAVASPVLNACTALMVMNNPSMEKFESFLEPGGVLVLDSTMVTIQPKRTDIRIFSIPASQIANEKNAMAFTNIILMGKLIKETGCVTKESFEKALFSVLPPKKHYMIPEEMAIFELGSDY